MQHTTERVFRHVDATDRLLFYAELAFSMFRYWGAAVFLLILGAAPAGLLFYSAWRRFGPALSNSDMAGVFAGGWLALSIPTAVFLTWLRCMRLKHDSFVVGAQGITYLRYPWQPHSIPWAEIQSVRDTFVPGRRNARVELIFQTGSGTIILDSQDWPIDDIKRDVAQFTTVARDHDRAK